MNDPRDEVVEKFRAAAEKPERVAARCRIAAKHYVDRDVPRGCAHAFAALRDIGIAQEWIDYTSKLHAGKAQIILDPGPTSRANPVDTTQRVGMRSPLRIDTQAPPGASFGDRLCTYF